MQGLDEWLHRGPFAQYSAGVPLKTFKTHWQWADTADVWPHDSFPLLLPYTLQNIVTNSYLLKVWHCTRHKQQASSSFQDP